MSFLDRLFGRERRAEPVRASDPYLAEYLGNRGGLAGYVSTERASGLAVAHACIAVVSQSLASVPLNLYRRTENGGRERATDHPAYGVLHDMANPTMTAFEAREYLIASLLVGGNAYAELLWNGRGQVHELRPLDPANVAVERLESGRLRYRVSDPRGGVRVLLQDEILHLRYRLARDGVMGLSPIAIARDTFALALGQADTVANLTEKGFRPSGALVFPEQLAPESYERIKKQTEARASGPQGAGKFIILDAGAKFETISIASKDAEFLESRKLTNLDIARIYSVPPTVVGITDHATYSNVDGESRALVVRCLAPMARRIEQAMNAALLAMESRRRMFIEHDLAGLLRGDMKARYEAYRIGRQWGWLSPNEIRGWENLPEVDGGNEYLSPLNMVPIDERREPEPGA